MEFYKVPLIKRGTGIEVRILSMEIFMELFVESYIVLCKEVEVKILSVWFFMELHMEFYESPSILKKKNGSHVEVYEAPSIMKWKKKRMTYGILWSPL